jgi:hypothetical protein
LRTALKAKATPSFVSPDNSRVGRARAALGRQCSLSAAATTTNPPRAARAHRPRPQAIQPRPLRNQLRRRAAEQARSPLVRRSRCQSRLCECPSLGRGTCCDGSRLGEAYEGLSVTRESPLPASLTIAPPLRRIHTSAGAERAPNDGEPMRLRLRLRPRPCASTASSAHQSLF